MDKFLSLVALLMITFGLIAVADGNFSAKPMIGAWGGAYIALSGMLIYVLAEILTVLKDICAAVTKRPND